MNIKSLLLLFVFVVPLFVFADEIDDLLKKADKKLNGTEKKSESSNSIKTEPKTQKVPQKKPEDEERLDVLKKQAELKERELKLQEELLKYKRALEKERKIAEEKEILKKKLIAEQIKKGKEKKEALNLKLENYREQLKVLRNKIEKREKAGEFTERLLKDKKKYNEVESLFRFKQKISNLPQIADLPKLYLKKPNLEKDAKILSFQEVKNYIGESAKQNLYLKGNIVITKKSGANSCLAKEKEYVIGKTIPIVGIFVEATEAIIEEKDIRVKLDFPYKLPLPNSGYISLDETAFLPKISRIEKKDGYIWVTLMATGYLDIDGTTYPDPQIWIPADN